MKRLIEKIVFCGLVTAWRLAIVPTRRSPEAAKATTDGVVRPPSAFSITVGSPPSSTAIHELVVPRSIPIVFPMCCLLLDESKNLSASVADVDAWPRGCSAHMGTAGHRLGPTKKKTAGEGGAPVSAPAFSGKLAWALG